MASPEGRVEFNGAWVINAPPREHERRAIIITGNARGGTSFAASAVAKLGVPFTAEVDSRKEINSRYEHQEMFAAFQNRDEEKLIAIRDRFDEQYDVWAWKLPALRYDLELAAKVHPNPYFVFIFKEPVSIGFRKNNLKGADVLNAMQELLIGYKNMVDFAAKATQPLLMIGYDSAMANLHEFVQELGAFVGVPVPDPDAVVEGIQEDGQRYYQGRAPFDPTRGRRKDLAKAEGTFVRKPNLTKKMSKEKSRAESAAATVEEPAPRAAEAPGLFKF
jgi:hypothetical protein